MIQDTNYYYTEVTAEEEEELRNLPKVAAVCQFMALFRNVLKINANGCLDQNAWGTAAASSAPQGNNKVISTHDLEQSILRPQFDPLVGELVSRLLQKNKWKLKEVASAPADKGAAENEPAHNNLQSYEQWNENLAKKFNVMYKNYKKFQLRFMKEAGEMEAKAEGMPGERTSMLIDDKFNVPVSHNIREHLL